MANYEEKMLNARKEAAEALNRAKEYGKKLRKQQGKERTHRICQRGGYIV